MNITETKKPLTEVFNFAEDDELDPNLDEESLGGGSGTGLDDLEDAEEGEKEEEAF